MKDVEERLKERVGDDPILTAAETPFAFEFVRRYTELSVAKPDGRPYFKIVATENDHGQATRAAGKLETLLLKQVGHGMVLVQGGDFRDYKVSLQPVAGTVFGPAVTTASIVGVLLLVTALLAIFLSRRTHRRISDQLLDLAHAVNAVSSRGDYSIRALRRSDDEIGILVDTFNHMLTQIELQDEQLKNEVERAEAAKVAKSQFLATMSHEIRTPINGILGMTQLLLDSDLNSEQNDFANTISRSTEGLLSIINDILDFSKGEAGRHQIEAIAFSPTKLIEECIETVAIVACEKQIELINEVDNAVPEVVQGDPARLRQVLLNLLSNALKFTSEGEIVARVKVESEMEDRIRIRFEVQDTGIGIPKDRLDRLFRSFSQVDASSNRKYGGTGLGLAISKQLIEAMGGTMFVRTKENTGSIFGFKVELPRETMESIDPSELSTPCDLRILLADPNATSRKAIVQMLQQHNTVEALANGADARQAMITAAKGNNPFDLVLLDVRLGDAFLAPITSDVKPPRIPLVLLAPVNQLAAASSIEWTGRASSVAKPVKRSDLFWCISEMVRGGNSLQEVPAALPSKAEGSEAENLETGDFTVLVAEDNLINQKITTKFLDKLGYQWKLANNGQEAVDAFRAGGIDLILMDVQMPVMDGLEATMAIRKLEALGADFVPIVALTANVLEEDRNRAHKAGFDDYLAKPVKLEQLEQTFQRWLARLGKAQVAGAGADGDAPAEEATSPDEVTSPA